MNQFLIILFFFFITILMSHPNFAQVKINVDEASTSQLPVDPDVRIGTLDNGIRYYIRKNQKPENRAELRLAVRAGAMQEDEDQLGLAHFVEHMAFNGSQHFKKNELIDYLETIGTKFGPDLNAYTSFDETVYMLQARTDSAELLQKGLLILEDWASGIAFEHEEIDKERGVVISEWRTSLSPDQRIFNKTLPIMYQGSRYAKRLPIGDPEIIKNADYETVKRFYKDWYRPDLMAVIVVGDVDVNEMEMAIKERFSNLKPIDKPRERKNYDVPQHKETLIAIVSDPEAAFTRVQLTYKHPHLPINDFETFRKSLVHSLYNRMLSSRLEELSKQADPPFTFAYSGYGRDLGDIDTYEGYAFVAEGGALRGLETLLVENERVRRHGFTQTELDRQKTELLKRMESAVKEKDKTNSRRFASAYVYNFLKDNPIPSVEQREKLYKILLPTIKLIEVNQLAKKWITNENRVVVVTGPEKEAVPLPLEEEIQMTLDTIKQLDIQPYVDSFNDAPLLDKKFKAAKIVKEKQHSTIGATELIFANGVRVVLKPTDFQNDEILMEAYSRGGTSLYGDDIYQSASAATSIVQESGIGHFNAIQLDKKLAGKKVRVSPFIGELFEGMNGSCSPEDLETMLKMTYLYFTAPRKDKTAVQSYIAKQKSVFKNLMSNPQYYFYDQTSKIKYNNHPRRSWPTEAQLESIHLEDAYKVYTDRFADASDFTFIFVGNFEVEAMKNTLATYLGNLPSSQRKEGFKDLDIDIVNGKIDKQFKRGEAPKALVEMTWHGDNFDWSRDNLLQFQSMISLLRIKMRESMREDKGGVYGVRLSGSPSKYPNPSYSITVSFNSEPNKAEELIQTALKDIATAQKIGGEAKDLLKVKETFLQSRKKSMKENRWWMSNLLHNYRNETEDFEAFQLDNFEKMVNEVTDKDIKKAANKYFNNKNFIKIVMLPEQ